MVQITFVFYY